MPEPTGTLPRDPAVDRDLLCPRCSYNLRGLHEYRCPECGQSFDPADLSETKLPWTHRRRLGRVRAYWATVSMVILRPRKLAAEMMHPQSYRDSQQFRWTTVGTALLPVLFATMVNWDRTANMSWAPPDGGSMGLGFAIIYLVAAAVTFAVITGLPSYWFHPRGLPVERQNRAIALSYYACAPLALGPFLFPIGWAIHGTFGGIVGSIPASALLAIQCVCWWRALVVLTRRGLDLGRPLRTITFALLLPALWIVIGNVVETLTSRILSFPAYVIFSLQD